MNKRSAVLAPGSPAALDRALAVIRPDIRALQAYAVQDSQGMVKLDAMENPYTLDSDLQAALGRRLGALALNRYPANNVAALREALRRYAQVPAGYSIVLGNGSDELISMLATAVAQAGASILAPMPGFVMYEFSAKLQNVGFVGVDLTPDFALDVPAMMAAIALHKPALVYLAYPNNPTANSWNSPDLEAIVRAVGESGGIVVFDEAYQPFAASTYFDRMAQHPHVLVLRTLSKFGLAGVRLGYLVGPTALITQIDKVRPPYNISSLNAECALFALDHQAVFAEQAVAIKEQRDRLMAQLAELKGVKVFPSEANMILVRLIPPSTSVSATHDSSTSYVDLVFFAMKEKGVLVKNVSKMHKLLGNCLRLTVGTPIENTQMLAALKASL
jgi:histidinol-phosphate aminotransferase